MKSIKTTLKTTFAALAFACCPAALAQGTGDDFERMTEIFQQNLDLMRQITVMIGDSTLPEANKTDLQSTSEWEIGQSEGRVTAFNEALASAKSQLSALPEIIRKLNDEIGNIDQQNFWANGIKGVASSSHLIICRSHNAAELPEANLRDGGRAFSDCNIGGYDLGARNRASANQ